MVTATREVQLGERRIPLVLPNLRDARLHTAAVIISIHVIGITALGFRVSVPQILLAILTAAVVDVALTFRSSGMLVWPASGMLTGSGVGLILRLVGMRAGDYWSFQGWHWFALVAGFSVLTKHMVRGRGSHLFNPSNVGLVLAFLILGRGLVEPLDFWWAPLGPWMLIAYAVIVVGGILITRRLRLLEMVVAFWLTLAVGLAILAGSQHCMIATWSATPVCEWRFWGVLVTSPEILVFMFFMITDPKTVPQHRTARLVFAGTLGFLATLLIAPNVDEFGAKVGLLGSLVLWSPLRALFDRWLGDNQTERSGLSQVFERLARPAPASSFARGAVLGGVFVLLAVAILIAGTPARRPPVAAATVEAVPQVDVDSAELPEVIVDPSVARLDLEVDDDYAAGLAITLAQNLALEAEALRTADSTMLAFSSGGERLDEIQARLDTAIATGRRLTDLYEFDSLRLALHEGPEGQTSAGLVFTAAGTVHRVEHDATGVEISRTSELFTGDFVLRRPTGERWLLVKVETAG